ncbi:MAG TPA: toll/interleukin-1 receptor domain-containing protein [Longimicrobium sp.]|jgi:hypothetical protein|uniref:toll/interleukin-1 receptor domain-containing protein n=1 Tax=Longimicrobium sp. TaxID=2029185 RepID=UPI002ED84A18
MARKQPTLEVSSQAGEEVLSESKKPLVFISHDTRDADIAEAFSNLLTDASGGILLSFRSSDRKGVAGIEFGAEWYRTIMERIDSATDVVALLTTFSINRPWILYEAGVAKGKLNRIVFGLAIGIPLTDTNVGPFAQFQNSGDDEDSLTKLVLQLIRRNPDAAPREEAVRRQVIAFREIVSELLAARQEVTITGHAELKDTEDVTKLFEEVKVMFRELPERLDRSLRATVRRVPPNLQDDSGLVSFNDILSLSKTLPPTERTTLWLIAAAHFRDSAPGIYEVIVEVYRAVLRRDSRIIGNVADSLRRLQADGRVDFDLFLFLDTIPDQLSYKLLSLIIEPIEQLAFEMNRNSKGSDLQDS